MAPPEMSGERTTQPLSLPTLQSLVHVPHWLNPARRQRVRKPIILAASILGQEAEEEKGVEGGFGGANGMRNRSSAQPPGILWSTDCQGSSYQGPIAPLGTLLKKI